MLQRLVREESGMTMALAIITLVIVGVMGSGLLVFAQRDLEAVIEVNNGQKAVEAADAGVQAARRQLLATSFPNSYNATAADNSEWAYNVGSPPGKRITFPDGSTTQVTIRYLPPAGSVTDPNYAPEPLPVGETDYKDGRDYVRVESEGTFGGSHRKIQAIYRTEDLNLPKTYFATKDINLASAATNISDVSLFAKGNITGLRNGMLTGTDKAYGNWQREGFNDKARLGNSTLPNNATGVGAEGSITYDPASYNSTQKQAPAEPTDRYKRLDFDGALSLSGTTPPTAPTPNYRFCGKDTACWPTGLSQPADVITYPFKVGSGLDDKLLQSIAEQQIRPGAGSTSSRDNYIEQPASAGDVTIDESNFYQVTPKLNSVFVVRFTGATPGTVHLSPTGSSSPCPIAGTILVINGSLRTSSSGARCFDGTISIQDPNHLGTLEYTNTGNFTLNGFANVDGTMNIQGSVNPILGDDILNQPGYHNVRLWSWRECYTTTCS